jgi:hypothetical protein
MVPALGSGSFSLAISRQLQCVAFVGFSITLAPIFLVLGYVVLVPPALIL